MRVWVTHPGSSVYHTNPECYSLTQAGRALPKDRYGQELRGRRECTTCTQGHFFERSLPIPRGHRLGGSQVNKRRPAPGLPLAARLPVVVA